MEASLRGQMACYHTVGSLSRLRGWQGCPAVESSLQRYGGSALFCLQACAEKPL